MSFLMGPRTYSWTVLTPPPVSSPLPVTVSTTYDALRQAHVVGGGGGAGLVGPAGIAHDSELLGARLAALAQTAHLHPVRAYGLVGRDDEVVALPCKAETTGRQSGTENE